MWCYKNLFIELVLTENHKMHPEEMNHNISHSFNLKELFNIRNEYQKQKHFINISHILSFFCFIYSQTVIYNVYKSS